MRYYNAFHLPRLDGLVDDDRIQRLAECDPMAAKWRGISNAGCGFPKRKRERKLLSKEEQELVRELEWKLFLDR